MATGKVFQGIWKARVLWPIAFGGTLLLASCRTVPDRAYAGTSEPVHLGSGSELFLIDVRQDGELSCAGENGPMPCNTRLERMDKWLRDESTEPPIILFVHGWHHNGDPGDKNLKGFRDFLVNLENRRRASGALHPEVDGIYVAWRGDSKQLLGPSWLQTLDFPTIYSRKRASIAVGSGGLKQIIEQLKTYQHRAVVVMGHSLGASAVFYAVKNELDEPTLDGYEFIMMNPAVAEREFDDLRNDLISRRNVESADAGVSLQLNFQRHRRRLMVLQALGDSAVGWAYKIAFAGTPVGFSGRQTHNASVCTDDCPPPPQDMIHTCYQRLPFDSTPAMLITAKGSKPECYDQMNKEIWVVTGKAAVSKSHNDIFNGIQADALAAQVEQDIITAKTRMQLKASLNTADGAQ